ncbi:jg10922 [Pararge aegeria aegeria]|uniref:Jg10922 protein n=1 Tax=Pararge aegeria aegeria TaxID=348720 RepID=A0A8S4S9Q2_9NEOP|nr:jg10922 [Pararge aegeria aegeria]
MLSLINFGHGDQSPERFYNHAGDITVHKCLRKHRCTLYALIRGTGVNQRHYPNSELYFQNSLIENPNTIHWSRIEPKTS